MNSQWKKLKDNQTITGKDIEQEEERKIQYVCEEEN